MKKTVAFALILALLMMNSAFADDPDIASYANSMTRRFAKVAHDEGYPYTFYEVVSKENDITYSDGRKDTYTTRSSSFYVDEDKTAEYTIKYDLSDRGFTIDFSDDDKPSLIRDVFTLTIMVVFEVDKEKADQLVAKLIPTYDGISRSEYAYSGVFVAYIQRDPTLGKKHEIVVHEREYFKNIKESAFTEMDYQSLTAFLNRGQYAAFSGKLNRITKDEDTDSLFVEMEDGHIVTVKIKRFAVNKPFVFTVGESYRFFVSIEEGSSVWDAGDLRLMGAKVKE